MVEKHCIFFVIRIHIQMHFVIFKCTCFFFFTIIIIIEVSMKLTFSAIEHSCYCILLLKRFKLTCWFVLCKPIHLEMNGIKKRNTFLFTHWYFVFTSWFWGNQYSSILVFQIFLFFFPFPKKNIKYILIIGFCFVYVLKNISCFWFESAHSKMILKHWEFDYIMSKCRIECNFNTHRLNRV